MSLSLFDIPLSMRQFRDAIKEANDPIYHHIISFDYSGFRLNKTARAMVPRNMQMVKRYWQDERTQAEIAAEFGLGKATVNGILRRHLHFALRTSDVYGEVFRKKYRRTSNDKTTS